MFCNARPTAPRGATQAPGSVLKKSSGRSSISNRRLFFAVLRVVDFFRRSSIFGISKLLRDALISTIREDCRSKNECTCWELTARGAHPSLILCTPGPSPHPPGLDGRALFSAPPSQSTALPPLRRSSIFNRRFIKTIKMIVDYRRIDDLNRRFLKEAY